MKLTIRHRSLGLHSTQKRPALQLQDIQDIQDIQDTQDTLSAFTAAALWKKNIRYCFLFRRFFRRSVARGFFLPTSLPMQLYGHSNRTRHRRSFALFNTFCPRFGTDFLVQLHLMWISVG